MPTLLRLCGLGAAACFLTSLSPDYLTPTPAIAQPALLRAPPPTVFSTTPPPPLPALSPKDFTVSETLDPGFMLKPGDFVWNELGVPAGQLRIVVDLKSQLLYVYRGGREIGRSTLIKGTPDKRTPTGIFPIMEKDVDHYSSTYGGAPMPYMQRLTGDGVSIHGAMVDPDYATHGCVGVPVEFAALLFDATRPGDYVLITRDWDA